MSGHTPGPWRVEEKPSSHGFIDVVDKNFAIAVVIGGLDDGPFDVGPVQQANARLIAAAPELLDALKEVTAAIHDAGFALKALVPDVVHLMRIADAVKRGLEVVAKAEGHAVPQDREGETR